MNVFANGPFDFNVLIICIINQLFIMLYSWMIFKIRNTFETLKHSLPCVWHVHDSYYLDELFHIDYMYIREYKKVWKDVSEFLKHTHTCTCILVHIIRIFLNEFQLFNSLFFWYSLNFAVPEKKWIIVRASSFIYWRCLE